MVPPRPNLEAKTYKELGDVVDINAAQCLDDKDKLSRWQEWWKGQNNGG